MLGSKGGVSRLWLPMPGLVFPSLDTSSLLLSELGCNNRLGVVLGLLSLIRKALVEKSETTRYRVRSSLSEGLTRTGGGGRAQISF